LTYVLSVGNALAPFYGFRQLSRTSQCKEVFEELHGNFIAVRRGSVTVLAAVKDLTKFSE